MNSLQIGLIGIGAFVVALLFAAHGWQSHRLRRREAHRTRPPKPIEPSALPDESDADAEPDRGRDEPTAVHAPRGERVEPTLDVELIEAWASSGDSMSPAPAVPPDANADARPAAGHDLPAEADVVATGPVPHEQAPAPIAPEVLRRRNAEWPFDERLHVHASIVDRSGAPFDAAPFIAAAGRAQAWIRLFRQSPWDAHDGASIGSVQQLALALPLASRAGPIEPHDLELWQAAIADLALQHDAEAHFHGFADAASRAVELDAFLAAVDVMPAAYVVKRDGGQWPGTKLRGTLEANGFRLQSDGRFAYHEVESDEVIFHAVDGFERAFTPERLRTESVTALRCVLEPARLRQPLARFDAFRQTLRALSKLLAADLKSSDGGTLDDAHFAAMRDEVKAAMDALVAADIEPGSDTARSLLG